MTSVKRRTVALIFAAMVAAAGAFAASATVAASDAHAKIFQLAEKPS
jgi:hypothetical protein